MRNRRGLSTMVGAVFFVIAMTIAISYIAFSMDTLDQFVQTVIVKSSVKQAQSNEDFEVSKLTIDSSKFNITVTNVGQIPINITRLWVENVTSGVSAIDAIPKSCDIKNQLGPKQTVIKIGQSCSTITASDTASYQMKLVTERGTTLDFNTNAPGKEKLLVSFIAIPDSIPSSFTTTLFLQIINNASSQETIHNIQPSIGVVSSDPSATMVPMFIDPNPSRYDSLQYGDTATFKWVYKIDAIAEETATFTMDLLGDTDKLNSRTEVVTMQSVLFAASSKSALDSEGLACCTVDPDLLVFHAENSETPNSENQMASMNADITGENVILYWDNSTAGNAYNAGLADDVANIRFLTNNDTNAIKTYYGAWNVTLRYWSEPFPHTVSYQLEKKDEISAANPLFKMKRVSIYHFDGTPAREIESARGDSSKDKDMFADGGLTIADYDATGGPHGSGAYHYSGTRHLSNEGGVDGDLEPQNKKKTATAGWFKLDPGSTGDRTIFFTGTDTSSPTDAWWIYVEDSTNNLIFYQKDGSDTKTCKDTRDFDDGTWHHFVAFRPDDDDCSLYVNGTLSDTQSGSDELDIDAGAQHVARIGAAGGASDNFEGYIDDIIFWRDKFGDVSGAATEAMELYKTNYGNASHVLYFNITKTDINGNGLDWINHTKAYNVTLPFNDPKGGYGTYEIMSSPPGGTFNYTFYPMQGGDVIFNAEEKFKVDIWHDPDVESSTFTNLPIAIRIDDVSDPDEVSSFLQMTGLNSTFPAFLTYDNTGPLEFAISNVGPDGIWLTFSGARVVFEPVNAVLGESYSYSAFLHSINSTATDNPADLHYLSQTKDSLYIDALTGIAFLRFFEPREIPEATTYDYEGAGQDCGLIPPGGYIMSVNIVGYDEIGSNLFRTFKVGKVVVVGDSTQISCES